MLWLINIKNEVEVMKKVSIVFFMMCGFLGMGFAGEDAVFDFTDNVIDPLDDTTRVRRTDDGGLSRGLPLDDVRDKFFTLSPTTKTDVVTSRPLVDDTGLSYNDYVIVDPQSFELDISPLDRAALDALNDDHVFFRDDLDDEDEKVTPMELYRIQLNDCRELIGKSADGVKKMDPVLYELVQPKFALVQKEVKNLMSHVDNLQESEIYILEETIQNLKILLIKKIVGDLFRTLIFDALELAGNKLSHIRVTLVKKKLKQKKKELHSGKNDSKWQIEEASYIDY